MYKGKKILITGGTGTIGYHLTKRLLEEQPSVIRIFSRDEYKQYKMNQDFQEHSEKMRFLIGDVRDEQRLLRALEGIDYVFHLAAMKQVPSCEYNPFEAVQTNVLGTQNVIQAAINAKVSKVLFTSTDKAISPTNTYGATKLTAERLISAAEFQKGAKRTVFSSVRFGNVMGSRGSVIPLFVKQILESRKITITDPNMLRYMMTPTQAISLMLKANEISSGGEVFVLKMPLVRLGDLAEAIIDAVSAKYNIREYVDVQSIGLRPGEKMYEELMTHDEELVAEETPDMFIVPSMFSNKKQEGREGKQDINAIIRINTDKTVNRATLKDWILTEKLYRFY